MRRGARGSGIGYRVSGVFIRVEAKCNETMKERELLQIGIPRGAALETARRCLAQTAQSGLGSKAARRLMRLVVRNPAAHTESEYFGALAQILLAAQSLPPEGDPSSARAPYRQWGENLDPKSVEQLHNACSLPISVRGALMPDAHVGYGLPIGGVLATRNAVIPYAVGVDIACRMKMTVLDLPTDALKGPLERLKKAIETETRFGVGVGFQERRRHSVMDRDWDVSPVTKQHKDKAWHQLGTSGSGNHFVEFGEIEILDDSLPLGPGKYVALLSHSGSRGTGALVCQHYSKAATKRRPELPGHLKQLAWLDLDSEEGAAYWAAMELMGAYAAANHELIHQYIARNLGAAVLFDVENHHNFAWKEEHGGETVVVHRKGATPAGEGVLGIIPGSMASPAYLVRGRGHPESLRSAAHGAGRVMSRSKAKKTYRWRDLVSTLEAKGVTLMSAGIDEAPMVYKNINEVMAAQQDLVETLARFQPKLVKMASAGERPED